ncbi:APC family permease [Papillibacter cinnamivorans]|uniref:Amino acid/polyamine/organocation transporter, APC superfamily n=1 Tax=Papillibacter cinnamivorans DSM 12816 TaxID=1122930 RepID=A0A1W2CPE1_9FIRM|nr:APC family permease [Papillibacter cinnamivorans]SMC86866.1 amino acid/polyamine/organocation transporter, APC superfamily [Papillibacter cinnamivorans DSM 12816]
MIGKPLDSAALDSEKFSVGWGLPILSSDAISSVAYAGQEILAILLPAIGILAYKHLIIISGIIILLLFVLMLSYRQTIEAYPNGGGAYTVAKENFGTKAGIVAGAALSVDYIMTVAVSVSSGVQQIVSAFDPIEQYTVPICVVLVVLIAMGNLRGIREASKIFGIPTYAFIFGILVMLAAGFIKIAGGYQPPDPVLPTDASLLQPITTMLMLKAFSNGCAALTGVEAVSNGVPNFKKPSSKHAQTVLLLLAFIILVLFGGTAILANLYKVVPGEKAILVLMASQVFGNGFMFYYVTITTFIILVIAANTAYSDFPILISIMAKDGFMPRQLSMRGNRLSYDSGILLLSSLAIILIILFKARVELLIGLYAIGVFISFTLSQSGMFLHWLRLRKGAWRHKALINGIGAIASVVVVGIIAVTKFSQGAWIVVIVIPLMVIGMLKIKSHYTKLHDQLRMECEEYETAMKPENLYKNRVIVPIESVNRASIRALRYAKTISDNITAFNVVIDQETAEKNRQKYDRLHTDIPLVIKYSPYREIVEPLLELIESAEYNLGENEIVSVILPQFRVQKFWHRILHNNTRAHLERELLKHKQIAICTIPLQVEDGD